MTTAQRIDAVGELELQHFRKSQECAIPPEGVSLEEWASGTLVAGTLAGISGDKRTGKSLVCY
jgi:hypothetical protein